MEQRELVAGVFEIPQRVAGNYGSCISRLHIAVQNALDQIAHDRIQAVERFVEQNVIRHGGQRKDDGGLTTHPLGERRQICLRVQAEKRGQLAVSFVGKRRVVRPVQRGHAVH